MITDTDIRKMKAVFATKDDLKNFATKDDLKRFVTKDYLEFRLKSALKSTEKRIITKVTNTIINRINRLSDYFDEKYLDHEKRIIRLEHRVSIIQPAQ